MDCHNNSLAVPQPFVESQDGPADPDATLLPAGQTFNQSRQEPSSMRMMHLNVRSLFSPEKRANLETILTLGEELDLDIMMGTRPRLLVGCQLSAPVIA